MADVLSRLRRDNFDTALKLAQLPDGIRGYGHVKHRNLEAARAEQARLLSEFNRPAPLRRAA